MARPDQGILKRPKTVTPEESLDSEHIPSPPKKKKSVRFSIPETSMASTSLKPLPHPQRPRVIERLKQVLANRRPSMTTTSEIDHVASQQTELPQVELAVDQLREMEVCEEVVGASDASEDNGITYLVKRKNVERLALVPAEIANVQFPQAVIKYCERKANWQKAAAVDKDAGPIHVTIDDCTISDGCKIRMITFERT